jgi:hypothetical protein
VTFHVFYSSESSQHTRLIKRYKFAWTSGITRDTRDMHVTCRVEAHRVLVTGVMRRSDRSRSTWLCSGMQLKVMKRGPVSSGGYV